MVGSVTVTGPAAPIVLKVVKSGDNVELSWPPQAAPVNVYGGSLPDLSDLTVITTVSAGDTFTDANAITNRPDMFFYQAKL
jgi:hypothetical protein